MFKPETVLVRVGSGRLAAELTRWLALIGVGVCVGRVKPDQLLPFMSCVSAAVILKIAADHMAASMVRPASSLGGGGNPVPDALAGLALALASWLVLLPSQSRGGPFPLGLKGAWPPLALFALLSAATSCLGVTLLRRRSGGPGESRVSRFVGRGDVVGLLSQMIGLEGFAWLAAGLSLCLMMKSAAGALWGLAIGSGIKLVLEVAALIGLRRGAAAEDEQGEQADSPASSSMLMAALGIAIFIDAAMAFHLLPKRDLATYGRLFLAGKFMLLPGVAMAAIVMQTMTDPRSLLADRRRSFSLAMTFLILIGGGGVALAIVKPDLLVEVLYGRSPMRAPKHIGYALLAQALGTIAVFLMRINVWSKSRKAMIIGPFMTLSLIAGYFIWHRRIADILTVQIAVFSAITLLMLIWTARSLGAGVTRAYDLESSRQDNGTQPDSAVR